MTKTFYFLNKERFEVKAKGIHDVDELENAIICADNRDWETILKTENKEEALLKLTECANFASRYDAVGGGLLAGDYYFVSEEEWQGDDEEDLEFYSSDSEQPAKWHETVVTMFEKNN